MDPQKIFPKHNPQNPIYCERYSWIRYAFFIATTMLFMVFFWGLLVAHYTGVWENPEDLQVIYLGSIVGPLIPILFYVRYLRSGYCVTSQALYCKEGFLFQMEVEIPFKQIKRVKIVKEKRNPFPNFGHFQLYHGNNEMKFLVDIKNPQELYVAIKQGLDKK